MPIVNVTRGADVLITHPDLVNLYGCTIDAATRIGPFVEIQKNSQVGSRCKISSHSFICEGVIIEDEVFVGHGVMFTNGMFPRATNSDGSLQTEDDWELTPTRVRSGASIGSNATIVAGVIIGPARSSAPGRSSRRMCPTTPSPSASRPGSLAMFGTGKRGETPSGLNKSPGEWGMHDKIGLIGYGYWGPNLARCIAEAEGCLLAGVADYSAAALARARKRYPGVRLLEDWREIAVDSDIDAVIIATPVAAHFEMALAALRAGKHVLVEKPITATSAEAAILIEEASEDESWS